MVLIHEIGVRFPVGSQNETSSRLSSRGEATRARGSVKRALPARTKSKGDGTEKHVVLSRTVGFVPIFWTNDLISEKSEEEDKKAACFVSKIHSRRGSTQYFPCCRKAFFFSFKSSTLCFSRISRLLFNRSSRSSFSEALRKSSSSRSVSWWGKIKDQENRYGS